MKHTTRWTIIAAATAAAAAALAWAFAPRPAEVEVANATRGPFEATIDEDAKTRLFDRYIVSAPLAGLLQRIELREGDAVDAGAVVATLAPALSPLLDERTLRDQQLRLEIAQAQRQRAEARVEVTRLAMLQASAEARRSQRLASEGFIAAARLETDRLAALGAQKEMDAAIEERRVAGHEIAQAEAALAAVRYPDRPGSRRLALRSPSSGRVLRVVQANEGAVAAGAPLLEIGDTRRLEIVAELLTADALQAKPGSRVAIERWGGPGSLQGVVRQVEPGGFTKISALGVEEQRVKVAIAITSPPEQWQALGDGFRVGVRIVITAVDAAVQVPLGAVFPLPGSSGMAVYVADGSHARLRPVSVGARNGSRAWIREGLEPGTTVIVYPGTTIADGARIRVRKV